jgi:ABC-type phosphate/phosphonate transport system substrate-binding protein
MRRRRALWVAGVLGPLAPVAALLAQQPSLRIALVPYLPPRALLEVWEPLRTYLAAALGERVEMYSAPNFRALIESARARAQDMTLTPVHLGQLLAREKTAVWIAQSARRSEVLLLTTLPEGASWEGRRFGTGDPLSILTLTGQRWLAANGLAGRVTVREAPNPATLALWLARGEVDAIFISSAQVPELPALRSIAAARAITIDTILTPGWQVPADTPEQRRQRLQEVLLPYRPADQGTAATAQWLAPDPAQLRRFDALAEAARAVLEARR